MITSRLNQMLQTSILCLFNEVRMPDVSLVKTAERLNKFAVPIVVLCAMAGMPSANGGPLLYGICVSACMALATPVLLPACILACIGPGMTPLP